MAVRGKWRVASDEFGNGLDVGGILPPVAQGVPPEDVAMDFAGRRTYDSVYRARHIFGQNRLIMVTQGFHMDRALFLCDRLGVEAYGVPGRWSGKRSSRIREIPACVSAVIDTCILHPKPVMGRRERI
jgi:SanA protein